ncbi:MULTISPECIES: Crp/Fnr family transcriptional regulator [unclassified Fusibacter]|uniref:Crp/Fnr family transcriptional regulator n=1 Tax=unclassified Fusibacter TaxID=2624464 RepID=UPI001010B8C8|nr:MULTISPECIES: Crp/Fnr family transcriptional regulator [unclassified Fusibacter]MCK8058610.1 Crp/Fnr family transcriptional regulator [Fusibacter sp. A2]NPE22620.1 Crp/Fnr family transcriptional regulator [Fusibacter sp. A1]RXV60184.1 Crp/Fnr family transcriptional regulator [Fusibacter sp. A1]
MKNMILLETVEELITQKQLDTTDYLYKVYFKNEVIHFEGERCTHFEIIIDGTVSVDRINENGNQLQIGTFENYEILGGNLLFSSEPFFPMTVTAQTKTRLLVITKEAILRLCTENQVFLTELLRTIADRSLYLGDTIKRYSKKTIRENIITYLQSRYRRSKSPTIELRLTKTELAQKLGVERTSLSRELQKMKKDGIIDFDNKSITILDHDLFEL